MTSTSETLSAIGLLADLRWVLDELGAGNHGRVAAATVVLFTSMDAPEKVPDLAQALAGIDLDGALTKLATPAAPSDDTLAALAAAAAAVEAWLPEPPADEVAEITRARHQSLSTFADAPPAGDRPVSIEIALRFDPNDPAALRRLESIVPTIDDAIAPHGEYVGHRLNLVTGEFVIELAGDSQDAVLAAIRPALSRLEP